MHGLRQGELGPSADQLLDSAGEAKSDTSGPWLGYLHVTRFRPTARQDIGVESPDRNRGTLL
jgi:hypothetical protein